MRPLIIVTGGSSGLGRSIIDELELVERFDIVNWSLPHVDLRDENSIGVTCRNLVRTLEQKQRYIYALVNCAGANKLSEFENLSLYEYNDTLAVNARAPWFIVQQLLPAMKGSTVLNIISNASHMPMTHSLAYNASKAALHMTTLQMARELGPSYRMTIFGVSPNKMSGTEMSSQIDKQAAELRGWTLQKAQEYQLSKLPTGKETPVNVVAEFIAFLLSKKVRHEYLHGSIINYGA